MKLPESIPVPTIKRVKLDTNANSLVWPATIAAGSYLLRRSLFKQSAIPAFAAGLFAGLSAYLLMAGSRTSGRR